MDLRFDEVINSVGLSGQTINEWEKVGKFPKRYRLNGHHVRWRQDEIDKWLMNHKHDIVDPFRKCRTMLKHVEKIKKNRHIITICRLINT